MLMRNYLDDGASAQSKAVIAMVQQSPDIEESWNKRISDYDARIEIGRWENCREQGYILSLRDEKYNQLNIAFFEHRNSDDIHAIKWVQHSTNTISIDNAVFPDGIYSTKYDTSFVVGYGEIVKMADWISEQLQQHWIDGVK